LSWFRPQPRRNPVRLPRRRPLKTIPSGLGDKGIVGNWLMYYAKGGNHLHDFSGKGNHGTIHGAKWVDGQYGWALDFDGGDVVEAPRAGSNLSEITYSVWVKADVLDGSYRIGVGEWDSTNGPLRMYIDSGAGAGQVMLYAGSPVGSQIVTLDAADALSEDTWYHVVGVLDGSDAHIYINGDLKKTASWSQKLDIAKYIGGNYEADNQYFDGTITIVRIYSIGKSGSWIERRFERTRGIFGI